MNLAVAPYLLLVPYAIFLLLIGLFALFNIGHLVRYGARNSVGFFVTFVYVCGLAIIMFMTWRYMPALDWNEPVPLVPVSAKASF